MKLGDLLEIVAAVCFAVAAVLATGLVWPGLVVAGVASAYLAQCYASHPVPALKVRRRS